MWYSGMKLFFMKLSTYLIIAAPVFKIVTPCDVKYVASLKPSGLFAGAFTVNPGDTTPKITSKLIAWIQ